MMLRALLVLMVTAGVVQGWIAWRFQGFLTGDEVEILSEAFRVATGAPYGLWDVRNRFVAHALVAPVVWLASRFGEPHFLVATLPSIGLVTLTVLLVHRLTLQWSKDPLAALAAASLFALHWMPLGFGGTTYPRVLSMACVAGAALLVARGGSPATHLLAGALAGIAFADRFSEIIFLLPLLLLAGRRAGYVAIGAFSSIALTVGVYDWLTWGEPFSSVRKFAQVTLVERDFSSRIQYQSPLWYLETLPRWCAPSLLPLLWRSRQREPWMFVIIPVVLLSLVSHKELRYLLAVIPFVSVLGGIGFAVWWRSHRKVAVTLLLVTLSWNLFGLRFVQRRSLAAVAAARFLGARPSLQTITIGQLWAYGDRLFLGESRRIIDAGTPPQDLPAALRQSDAAALYESDLTTEVMDELARAGFARTVAFRTRRARDVIVFRRTSNSHDQQRWLAKPTVHVD